MKRRPRVRESNRDAVIDNQTYALKLDGSTPTSRAPDQGDGWHNTAFARNGEVFVDTYSNPDTPPQVSIRRPDGSMIEWLEHNELNASTRTASTRCAPENRVRHAESQGRPDPVLLDDQAGQLQPGQEVSGVPVTYGGPHSQHVRAAGATSTSTWRSKASSSGAWTTVVRAAASAPSPTPTTINWAAWKWKTS
jgi:dipeptidyl-peptidase-4